MSNTIAKEIVIPAELLTAENIKYTEKQNTKEALDELKFQHSTSNDLYKTKPGGLRMVRMKGGTEQGSLKGTNLFGGLEFANAVVNAVTSNAAGINSSNKTLWISASAYTNDKCVYSDFKENTQYTFFIKGSNSNSDYSTVTNLKVLYTDGTYSDIPFTQSSSTVFISKKDKTIEGLYTVYFAGVSTIYYEDFGIFEGVLTLDDYEPYCGGIPAPNPSYPIPIENTFDAVEMMQGYYNMNTGAYGNTTTSICSKYKIPCKEGDVVKLAREQTKSLYIMTYNGDSYVKYYDSSGSLEVTIPSGVTQFGIRVDDATNGITPSTVGKIQLTVNEKYVGQIVEHGKNLFDESVLLSLTGWSLSSGYYTGEIRYLCARYSVNSFIDEFKENTQYTISLRVKTSITNDHIYLLITYSDGSTDKITVGNSTTEREIVIITDVDKTVKSIKSSYGNNATMYIKDFLIQEGAIENPTYEPYTEHVCTFYMDEPPRKGDVLFKDEASRLWTIERNRVVEEVNVTEIHTYGNYKYATIKPTNYKESSINRPLCDRATYDGINHTDGTFYQNPTNMILVGTVDDTLETLQNKYNGTMVEYNLATPTYEILDNQSQIALNSLKTFNGATHVEVNSKIPAEECEWEFGTNETNARLIATELRQDTQDVLKTEQNAKIEELSAALLVLTSESEGE